MRLRLEQRKHLDKRLQAHADRAAAGLSGDRGRADRGRADRISSSGSSETPRAPRRRRCRQRVARVRGALTWRLRTQYHERLTEAHAHLNELNAVDRGADRARTRRLRADAAGGDAQLRRLRRADRPAARRVGEALQRVEPADGAPGTPARDRRHQRARGAPRATGWPTRPRRASRVADSYDRAARRRRTRPECQTGECSGRAQPRRAAGGVQQ